MISRTYPVSKPIKDYVAKLFWQISHNRRRNVIKRIYPKYINELDELRQMPLMSEGSLASFDKHKCIFVHVPKCAGLSISISLFGLPVGTHNAINTFELIYDQDEFESYFKFSFVRNPWSRAVSAFHFLKKGGLTEEDRLWAEETLSDFKDFDTFVKQWLTPRNALSWQHFKPQSRFLFDSSGNMPLDFIGRFENISEDFAYVAKKLNIDSKLMHVNRSLQKNSNTDWRLQYTDESRKIVAEIYKKDIEYFDYKFDKLS